MGFTNSQLVNFTQISPNKSVPKAHAIDRVTIHCYVGQTNVENMGAWFVQTSAKCSSNYGIGSDGRVGLFVQERDRSWCSSSSENDNRAVTIECDKNIIQTNETADLVVKVKENGFPKENKIVYLYEVI